MMRPNKMIVSAITSLLPVMSFAMTCPTNFNIIHAGDSTDTVTQLCGKPDSSKESTKPNENVPQEWSYFIPQTVADSSMQQVQGSLKTSIVFDSNGKAVNITVNGIGVGASTICGSHIELGSSRDEIKSACGDPAFVNKQSGATGLGGSGNPPADIKNTEFDYNTNPPQKLMFENGKLQEQ